MTKFIGIFVGGLLLTIVLASPASAGGTAGPSPSPTACPAGQFMSPLGCTLIGSGSGADGAQTPTLTKSHRVIRHTLPLTGSPFPVGMFALFGILLIITGGVFTTAGSKR